MLACYSVVVFDQVCTSGVGSLNDTLSTEGVKSMVLSIPPGLLRGGASYRVSVLAGNSVISTVSIPVSLLWKDVSFNFNIAPGIQRILVYLIYCSLIIFFCFFYVPVPKLTIQSIQLVSSGVSIMEVAGPQIMANLTQVRNSHYLSNVEY